MTFSVTSRQNPLVKQIRQLHSPKGRREQQQFLLEGTHLVEVASNVNYPLEIVCATAKWQSAHPQLWQRLEAQAVRMVEVSEVVIEAIATTVNPDGVVAVAPRGTITPPPIPTSGIVLAMETIQNPGNLGTIIRTAVAAGACGLWISADSTDLDHPKVLRASAGEWFRLPMGVCEDLTAQVQLCRSQGVQVIATAASAKMTHWEIDYRQPTVILLGNEGAGLSAELGAIAHQQVRIPLSPGVESLNVSIAAAVILYEALRQTRFVVGL